MNYLVQYDRDDQVMIFDQGSVLFIQHHKTSCRYLSQIRAQGFILNRYKNGASPQERFEFFDKTIRAFMVFVGREDDFAELVKDVYNWFELPPDVPQAVDKED